MADHAMKELEQASQIALAPPTVVTSEQRHAAENIILNFRKTKMPYNICRFILENSSFDYVLFQAATAIKEAIVREWTLLNAQDIESLRSFLLRFITKNISLQSYVREQILQTVAVILKRGTLETDQGCDCLFEDVTQLISSGNVTMQLVACSMLSALLNEYSTSSRMSSVGFTWEFHMKCKQAFEQSNLKRVFMFSLQVLHEIEGQGGDQLSREVTAVLNRVLTIAEQILSWEFTPRHNYHRVYPSGSFVTNQNVSLRPNEAWRDVLLRKETLSLFFRIHKKVRHNEEMSHHSLMCISQLASINGMIFSDDKARVQYLTSFLEGLLQLLTTLELRDYEHLGTAMTIKNLVMMFPFSCIANLPENVLESLVTYMTSLTCILGVAASQEEMLDPDDTLHMEAYEKLLDTWLTLVEERDSLPSPSLIQPQAAKLFTSYMMCHLGPPHGSRGKSDSTDAEVIEEIEEDDRDKFADQLCSIGALARVVPDHSVPLMASVLEDLVVQYSSQLQQVKDSQAAGKADLSEELALLNTLHEDLHWTLLVTTFTLTEGFDGETPMIPSSIIEYSIAQSSSIDLHKTMQLLASGSQSVASSPEAYTHVDKVIRLIVSVLRLCQIETQAVAAELSFCLSPQVASTVMWSLRRWAAAYLLPNESYYSKMSQTLTSAFGKGSEGGKWMVDILLQKVISNVTAWSSETSVMTDSLMLLVTLVDNKTKAQLISVSPHLWQLAHIELDKRGPARQLASLPRRLFMKGLVMACTGIKDNAQQLEFWKLVLETTRSCFYSTVQDPQFSSKVGSQHSKEELMWVLESLIGISQGTRVEICEHIFTFLHPMLVDSVKLLEVYRDSEEMVYLILEVFSEVVQHHLCYLGESSSQKLCEVSLSAIQMYSKYHSGTRKVSEEEEENKFNDISIVMELLMNLLAKDFLDFGPEEDGVAQSAGAMASVAVVLYGLEIIVPLMTNELLKFPSLCLHYYKLITFLAEIHADKFSGLAPGLFQNIVASMELGLLSFGSDINKMCLEALGCLAAHVYEEKVPESQLSHLTEHFLAIVFRMLLLENFDMTLMDAASTTFFSLICCHQAKYQELVNQLLEQHSESEYKGRLLSAFTELTPHSLPLNITRQNKIAFRSLFDKFMNTVWGFLCVR